MNPFQEICSFAKKSDLKTFCSRNTVTSVEMVDFIFAVNMGHLPWVHLKHTNDFVPAGLILSNADLQALATAPEGVANRAASKAFNKVPTAFKERKMFVAHLFCTPSLEKWHLFWFDQRDIGEGRWKCGPHIHLINWLWAGRDCVTEWGRATTSGKPQMKSGLHLRFDRLKH